MTLAHFAGANAGATPGLARCHCGAAPEWFAHGDGRGRYQHAHPDGDWFATRGPLPEPEAAAEWNQHFGAVNER